MIAQTAVIQRGKCHQLCRKFRVRGKSNRLAAMNFNENQNGFNAPIFSRIHSLASFIWFGKKLGRKDSDYMNFLSCPCHQLTIRETAGDAGGRENPEAGYVHRLDF